MLWGRGVLAKGSKVLTRPTPINETFSHLARFFGKTARIQLKPLSSFEKISNRRVVALREPDYLLDAADSLAVFLA